MSISKWELLPERLGTYLQMNSHGTGNNYGVSVKFSQDVTISKMSAMLRSYNFAPYPSMTCYGLIYDAAASNRIAISDYITTTLHDGGLVEFTLTEPITLIANKEYKMCVYAESIAPVYILVSDTADVVPIDCNGIIMTPINGYQSERISSIYDGIASDCYVQEQDGQTFPNRVVKNTKIMNIGVIPANTPPTITGEANEDLGDSNTPFNITYSVNDVDSANVLNIVEKLNGNQINSISNAPRNTNFTINITKEILDGLPLNQQNTILISVTDGSATTYKTITFKRTNAGPVISNLDKDLGQVAREAIAEKYTCHDVEGNTFTIVEKVDNVELKNIPGIDGTEYTISIPEATWLELANGTHAYTITATDLLGASTIRTITFTKKETIIESTGFANVVQTDAAATKILITPSWSGIENADVKIEVCNNAHDVAPTWEDATSQVLINKAYMFTNTIKTGSSWGIDVKFKITRKDGTTGNIDFYGLGGSFE